MPELPEVETITRGLKHHLLNRLITEVRLVGHPLFKGSSRDFFDAVDRHTVRRVTRHGKAIFIALEPLSRGPQRILRIHLGMTGQLLIKNKHDIPQPHTHLVFHFDDPSFVLHHRDIRRFGRLEVRSSADYGNLAPDAWTSSDAVIQSSIAAIRGFLKHALLNQKVIAGLGNIYVDESLYRSKLHPLRRGLSLTHANRVDLTRAVRSVLGESIRAGGTSFQNYVDIRGSRGGFKSRLSVYGKAGQACACGTVIKRIVVAGRGTYYCPRCQRRR